MSINTDVASVDNYSSVDEARKAAQQYFQGINDADDKAIGENADSPGGANKINPGKAFAYHDPSGSSTIFKKADDDNKIDELNFDKNGKLSGSKLSSEGGEQDTGSITAQEADAIWTGGVSESAKEAAALRTAEGVGGAAVPDETTGEAKPTGETPDVPVPGAGDADKPANTAARAITATEGKLSGEVLNTQDTTNRDILEQGGALDGQMGENTTWSKIKGEDGKDYFSYRSNAEGLGGKDDIRYGKVPVSYDKETGLAKLPDGVNLGAAKGVEALTANEKALMDTLASKREAAIDSLGYSGFKDVQKLQGQLDNIQANLGDKTPAGVNELMQKVNEAYTGTTKDGKKAAEADLASLKEGYSKLGEETKSVLKAQRLKELGASAEKLGLNADSTMAEIDDAVDKQTAENHQFDKDGDDGINKLEDFSKELDRLQGEQYKDGVNQQKIDNLRTRMKALEKAGVEPKNIGQYLEAEIADLQQEAKLIDDKKAADEAAKKAEDAKRSAENPVDLESDAYKKLAETLGGADKVKAAFGDDYENNPALKSLLSDFGTLTEKGQKSLLESVSDPVKLAELKKEIGEQAEKLGGDGDGSISALEKALTETKSEVKDGEEPTDAQTKAIEAAQTKLDEAQKYNDNLSKLKTAAEKYSAVKIGEDEKQVVALRDGDNATLLTGEQGTVDDASGVFTEAKSQISEALTKVLDSIGIPKDEQAKWAEGGTVTLSADECEYCPKGTEKERLKNLTEAGGKPYKLLEFAKSNEFTKPEAAILAGLQGNSKFPEGLASPAPFQ